MRASALAAALALAAAGLPVFPCRRDKRPATRHGFHDATLDPERIRRCWWYGALVGVPTGEPSGIAVLDIDPRTGGDEWLAAHAAQLPRTRVHETRSGGRHLLFAHVPGVRCGAGSIAPGVDVRAGGGYVVWWPAHGFAVLRGTPLDALPDWPDWLMPLRRTEAHRRIVSGPPAGGCTRRFRQYAVGALRDAVQRIATAPEGARNETLNKEAFKLRYFLDGGGLGMAETCEHLARAATCAGLDAVEIERTLVSALTSPGQPLAPADGRSSGSQAPSSTKEIAATIRERPGLAL